MEPCEGPGIWHNNLLQYVKKDEYLVSNNYSFTSSSITPPSLCYIILLLNHLFYCPENCLQPKVPQYTSHDGICQRACQKMVVLGLLTFEYTKFYQQE